MNQIYEHHKQFGHQHVRACVCYFLLNTTVFLDIGKKDDINQPNWNELTLIEKIIANFVYIANGRENS